MKLIQRIVPVVAVFSLLLSPVSVSASQGNSSCNSGNSYLLCDDFFGTTKYVGYDQGAIWNKYAFNKDNAASYNKIGNQNVLRLTVDEKATSDNYSNANISTSEINNFAGNFLFGENTRVDVRMKYDSKMASSPFAPAGAKGSAGLLFWNYFTAPVDPELKDLTRVRDAFGFVWQDETSVPTPGFWSVAVAQGMPGAYVPQWNVDISEFHTYSLERTHTAMNYFIDGQLVASQPLNVEGGLYLPSDSKLSVDMWVDNTTYVLDFSTFQIDLEFNDLTTPQSIDIDYVKVTAL